MKLPLYPRILTDIMTYIQISEQLKICEFLVMKERKVSHLYSTIAS